MTKVCDDPLDYSLPENPDFTKIRLQKTKAWKKASGVHRMTTKRHSALLTGGDAMANLTFEQRLESHYVGWLTVMSRWPPPADAVPLASLRDHLTANDNVVRNRFRNEKRAKREQEQAEQAKKLEPTTADIDRWSTITTINHDDDVTWVYLNIDNPDCYPRHAPSRGAWTMLLQAKENKQWFYDKHYRPMAERQSKLRKSEGEYEYKPSRQERLDCEEIRDMLNEARVAIGLDAV